ncbi:SusC/RagA family TonB-linked outer membrane protein [Flavilitoribacter nigricans]|uniref:SusC/RagA family TonB-linked outer membrane protein n=1 Tax=Flavilitoribacter nigricans (strain ATCC 23147 / DSM 23189 / NBRC 102662 / NCIMB 1420 / SS-2) TaxID=1122177 RepID=A0A2D0NJA9_FLAN2|nr:TonB-dependent receptor [Flavilitoribacter nigricans]PHN08581.1 SusC/RagA family TonB-linked outer membrane protein [Flavilitoribacter nigricans DSM 23189 = NBRC 102662]
MEKHYVRKTGRYLLLGFLQLVLMGNLFAQREVAGIVTSEGIPLIGVNIVEKGTANGTVTDIDGKYNLTVDGDASVLIFTYTGYQAQEVEVGNQSTIDLVMAFDAANLEEVVVVGFGSKKKAHVTGAASSVEMTDVLANRPVTNSMEALQGTVPGLQITNNSGQPGPSGLGINIRGTTSINGGSPLILLDNVPVTVEDINPQDVASITVLKDAAATSIYGARAAFGVVLITTKSGGKNQPVKFNYSSTFSTSSPEDIPEKASTYDFVNALNDWGVDAFWTGQDIPSWVGYVEEYRNNPGAYPEGYAVQDGLRYPLADTDLIGAWLDDRGVTQIHNFNFSGGGASTTYRVSAGFSDEDGIIVTRNDSYRKYNLNASLTTELTDKLTATTNVLYRNSVQRDPLGSYSNAITFNAYTPATGNHVFDDGTEVPYFTPANIEHLKEAPKTLQDNIRLFGKLNYNLLPGLNLTGEYTFQKSNNDQITSDNQVLTVNPERFTLNAVDPVNTFYRRYNGKTVYNALNLYASYDLKLGDHSFGLLSGFNQENSDFNGFWVRKTNLINVDLPSISGASGTVTGDDSFGQWSVRGFFGRFNYNYKEKYFLEANGRYDGSSRFPDGNRFGFFPSFSAGWHIGREAILQNISFLSDLKLRASWGEIGNQDTPSLYPAVPGMPIQNASWLDESSGVPYVTLGIPSLVSSSFTWERVRTLNFGVDAVFFKGRLTTALDIFKRETIGMLIPGAELPAVLGASAPTQNAADLESKGWELGLSWNDRKGAFSYNIGVSLSDNRSFITKFDNPAGLLSQYFVGQELGSIWGYVSDGYYTEADFVEGTLNDDLMGGTLNDGIPTWEGRNQNPGDIKYVDQNGDGIINDGNNTLDDPGDRVIIGNNNRRYQYGIFGNFSFKNIDLAVLVNGVGKRDLYQNNNVRFPYTDEFKVVYISQLDYWTPDNRNAYFPRNYSLGGVNYGINRTTQTKYLLDGAYLRVKNITLGYTLPQQLLSRIGIDRLRVYVAGENVLDFNDYPDGINTELQNKSQGATYPYMRSFSAGVNLTF